MNFLVKFRCILIAIRKDLYVHFLFLCELAIPVLELYSSLNLIYHKALFLFAFDVQVALIYSLIFFEGLEVAHLIILLLFSYQYFLDVIILCISIQFLLSNFDCLKLITISIFPCHLLIFLSFY